MTNGSSIFKLKILAASLALLLGTGAACLRQRDIPWQAAGLGGRAEVRLSLYLAGFIASRYDPRFRAFRKRLEAVGKPTKVAIVAVARKLLTILNAMFRDGKDYRSA